MSLTATQSAWLADFDTNVAAFRTAIEAAMEADNDPASLTLEDAVALADDLKLKFSLLALNLGYTYGGATPQYNVQPGAAPLCLLPGTMWYRSGSYPSYVSSEVQRDPPNQANPPTRAYGWPLLTKVNQTY